MTDSSSALWLRARIVQSIREFFWERGFLEVETPVRIPANAPEEHIDPVPSGEWFLQTSPEICMKRLLCRGHSRLFQICRCWRADERGTRHLSEFTMLEWYRSNADYTSLMKDCEQLLRYVGNRCLGNNGGYFTHNGRKIDPDGMWLHITVQEAFSRFAKADALVSIKNGLFDEIMVKLIEPALADFEVPVFLVDYPSPLAALARHKPKDPLFSERFELYVGGLELANGFSELNDPDEQRMRFEKANRQRFLSGVPPLPLPEPFLEELRHLPAAAGIALGVDRLVMLCSGAQRIDDIVAFTPEQL